MPPRRLSRSRFASAHVFAFAFAAVLAGCGAQPGDAHRAGDAEAANADAGGSGEFISTPVEAPPEPYDVRKGSDWPPAEVGSGTASVSCELDYATHGDGMPLVDLRFFNVLDALKPCQELGLVRLRYKGKITADFTALVERVAAMAARMEIDKRVLDIDSTGGQVEDAIRAGDAIGASGWTVWVREGAACHSACVLILGAGDVRMISGQVGIHRIIRMSSTATTRAELNKELQAVYTRVKEYLERNGVAVAVADQMMAVPNRNLRLLTAVELQEYGLDGTNPAQDDLDRLKLMRRCGEDFVRRRDGFARAFDRECKDPDKDVDELNACGVELRTRFGFPDATCPEDSPMSEFDVVRSAFNQDREATPPATGGGAGAER
jgi:ATP-dependent protease ClpP protease subunit